jgi:hypothetical protein
MISKEENISQSITTTSDSPVTFPVRTLTHPMVVIVDLRVLACSADKFYTIGIQASVLAPVGGVTVLEQESNDKSLNAHNPPWKATLSVHGDVISLTLTGQNNTNVAWTVKGSLLLTSP